MPTKEMDVEQMEVVLKKDIMEGEVIEMRGAGATNTLLHGASGELSSSCQTWQCQDLYTGPSSWTWRGGWGSLGGLGQLECGDKLRGQQQLVAVSARQQLGGWGSSCQAGTGRG